MVSRVHVSPGWRCPEAFSCAFVVGVVDAIATMLH
jgi:hypothetical protein